MANRVLIFDTTLRDGEQVPGAKLNLREKVVIAKQLELLGVDYIEAGFPSSSHGDFEAVRAVARAVKNPIVTGLARAVKADIDSVYESVREAENPMIHIVLGASDIHVEHKFNKSSDEILNMGVEAVKYAKKLLPVVQYSTEDASRADFEYLWRTIEAVIQAGATIVNVPDTVGYAVPEEFGEMISKLNYRMKNINPEVILSVHCHNDTGLATANSLIAIKNGADKVECTINGIGERAGNASLEEIVMGLKVRENYYNAFTNINTKEIIKTSKLVSALMGLDVQVNKAITGENAFAHSSGIHQDGLLKARDVYEIINPKDVGVEDMELVLTARSGRHAVKSVVEKMGYSDLSEESFERIHQEFLKLADKKKEIYYHDLYYLVQEFGENAVEEGTFSGIAKVYELMNYQVISSSVFPSASVELQCQGECLKSTAAGNGPIDALYSAIREITGYQVRLREYNTNSISQGKEAMGRVRVKVEHGGKVYTSSATDTDVLKASAIAYLNCINQIEIENTR